MDTNVYDIWKEHSNTDIEYESYFNSLLQKIKDKENFTFIRICDGEYGIIVLEKSHDNRVDLDNILKTKKELNKLLKIKKAGDPNLLIGIQFGTSYDEEYIKFVNKLNYLKKEGYSCSLMSWACVTDKLPLLFSALTESQKPLILIGPEYLSRFSLVKFDSHIITPGLNVWEHQDHIESLIESEISKYENPILLYCCSITGKIAMSKNYIKYKNKITQIDVGSNLDPFSDEYSRPWHYNMK
jgi:hypothetical protein